MFVYIIKNYLGIAKINLFYIYFSLYYCNVESYREFNRRIYYSSNLSHYKFPVNQKLGLGRVT